MCVAYFFDGEGIDSNHFELNEICSADQEMSRILGT